MKKCLFSISIFLLLSWSCSNNNNNIDINSTSQPKASYTPSFNADSAYFFVEQQVNFGPRVPNSAAHQECANYLINTLQNFVDTVIVQTFTAKAYNGTTLNGKNIIGCFNKENPNRILLAAHWDSRPYADNDADIANSRKPIDGANDGASGVGVLLEIARQVNIKKLNIGIDIIFFDIEDYGEPNDERHLYTGENWALGSQHWAKNPHKHNYQAKYGILLDMVGGKNAHFPKEGTSHFYAATIQEKIWNNASILGYGNRFTKNVSHPITDDHLYVNTIRNIQMVDIIDIDIYSPTGFNPTWHTINDNMENIDKHTLGMVGNIVLYTLENEK